MSDNLLGPVFVWKSNNEVLPRPRGIRWLVNINNLLFTMSSSVIFFSWGNYEWNLQ